MPQSRGLCGRKAFAASRPGARPGWPEFAREQTAPLTPQHASDRDRDCAAAASYQEEAGSKITRRERSRGDARRESCLVMLVVGWLDDESKDRASGPAARSATRIETILPEAARRMVALRDEPCTHAGRERACVNTLEGGARYMRTPGRGASCVFGWTSTSWWDTKSSLRSSAPARVSRVSTICDWLVPTRDLLKRSA